MAKAGGKKIGADSLIDLLIFLMFLGALLPTIITQILAVNTTDWDASTLAIWSVVTIVIMAGIVLGIKNQYL